MRWGMLRCQDFQTKYNEKIIAIMAHAGVGIKTEVGKEYPPPPGALLSHESFLVQVPEAFQAQGPRLVARVGVHVRVQPVGDWH